MGRECALGRVSFLLFPRYGSADKRASEFAHVEFTAVLATTLTKYRILPAAIGDESEEEAREGLVKVVAGSTASMAVNIAEPEELWLKLVKR